MPQFDSKTTSALFTDACTISDVWGGNGGYFIISGADVYAALQWNQQGQGAWTDETHVPAGNGQIFPGTSGIRFRSYVAGSPATVSASIAPPRQPSLLIGNPSTVALPSGTELAYSEIVAPVTVNGAGILVVTAPAVTFNGTTVVLIDFYSPELDVNPTLAAGGNDLAVYLEEDGNNIGTLYNSATFSGIDVTGGTTVGRRMTPAAGPHTYAIRASRSAANAIVQAGPGGAGVRMPAYIRITQAV